MEIKNNDLEIAGEIISAGLRKAAESLSFLMKEKIETDSLSYTFPSPLEPAEAGAKAEYYILVTRIIGEISGICCLIINPGEAERIRNSAVPDELKHDAELMRTMKDAVLLEVDNIISASVITQFSQTLKSKMHGGVPDLKVMTHSEMENYIQSLLNDRLYFLRFNTRFMSVNLSFYPHFLWFFDQKFYEKIQSLSSQQA